MRVFTVDDFMSAFSFYHSRSHQRAGIRINLVVVILHAVANLCRVSHEKGPAYARRMVALLVDGLRYGASADAM